MGSVLKKSLQVKLAVYMILMVTAIIVMMTFASTVAYQNYAKKTLLTNTEEHLKALSYTISAALEFSDRELVKESLGLLRNTKEYISATVYGEDHSVFVREGFKDSLASRSQTLDIEVPVTNELKATIGSLKATITLAYLNRETNENILKIIAFAVIVLAGSFLMAFFMTKRLIRPLMDLKTAIEEMSYRSSVEKVGVVSEDEIGELAKAFNQMSENLKKTMTSRDLLAKEIEDRKKAERELQEAQSQLVQSEKMASIGQLAAGVAHEINNPIGFVSCNMQTLGQFVEVFMKFLDSVELLKNAVGADDPQEAKRIVQDIEQFSKKKNMDFIRQEIPEIINESKAGLGRVEKIVLDLRTFSRSDHGELELVSLREAVQSVLTIVHNEIKYKCALKEEHQEVPLVKCNAQRLSQVLLNLIINASQAVIEKGTIIIRTYRDGNYACIDVEDDGPGIPPEKISKIFDPFYTTKPVGKGTGLGLSISYEIIRNSGGDIKVDSQVGRGSKFTIQLPFEEKAKDKEKSF